jgi:hypothetical protein
MSNYDASRGRRAAVVAPRASQRGEKFGATTHWVGGAFTFPNQNAAPFLTVHHALVGGRRNRQDIPI